MSIRINLKKRNISIGWNKGNKSLDIQDFRLIRKQNREEYPNDPDINTRRIWGVTRNDARKGNPKDFFLDTSLHLGHIEFNYTNADYNKKYRKAKEHTK